MIVTPDKLVLGRGEVYFAPFAADSMQSDGEVYLGNTPGFSLSHGVEEVSRFTSHRGKKVAQDSYTVRETYASSITTDNVSSDNLALWIGGEIVANSSQAPLNFITETLTVRRGRYYQLGLSYVPFNGVKYVEPNLVVTKGGSPISIDGNIELIGADGRIYVLPSATDIADGDEITVKFEWRRSPSQRIEPEKTNTVVGALRFIAKNPFGPNKSYFFPYVRMKPAGQIDFKGDQWQQMAFDVDVRKLNASTEFFYVLEGAEAQHTHDEEAILAEGSVPLEDFPYWEDMLNTVVNINIPAADYGQVITYP